MNQSTNKHKLFTRQKTNENKVEKAKKKRRNYVGQCVIFIRIKNA